MKNPNIATRSTGAPALAGVALALTLALGACASVPPPTEQMAVASAAVANAAAAGGQEGAPVDMTAARDKLRRANLALADKDNALALRLAQQAQLDAQVAESRAESAKALKAAEEVRAASRALAEEMGRKAQ